MKINKLIINNFFRYYGKQVITFSTNEETNVTVIRGENGSGKTTLLNAFYWVMYGDVLQPLTINNMLNYRVKEELLDGSIASADVQLEFEDRGKLYSIIRKQKFIKQSGIIRLQQPEILYISYIDENGNDKEVTEKNFFESIIPKRLRGFFFFDGERINKLAQIDGKDEIKKAILDVLGLTTIDNTSKDLDVIRNEYTKELAKNGSSDEKKLAKELESAETELSIVEEVLKSNNEKLSNFEKELEVVNEYLKQSNSEIVKEKLRRRNAIDKSLKTEEKKLEDTRLSISNHISKNLKSSLISTYFDDIEEYLETKREKGELPSGIKVQFIEDLLEKETCICGCKLYEGTDAYNNIVKKKSVAGRNELDDAYINITSYIKKSRREDKFYEILENLNKEEIKIIDNIDEYKTELDDISNELKNSNEERIRHNESRRADLNSKIKDIINKIGNTERHLTTIKKEIEKIREKINLCSINNKISKKIRLKIDQVESLIQLNSEIKEYFIDTTRKELDEKIKEVFGKITRKEYRIPVLTKDFELKIQNNIKNSIGNTSEVLSTGEGQITSLSFIGSLVEYAKEKNKEEFLSDFSGGDFPIVMDSPFGNLDEIHTANVAANIGKLASQVIIVVSDKQWKKDVEDNIKHQVGKMYKMCDVNDNEKDILETTVIKEEDYCV